ncbi:MAG TPA: CBS domain-containing protein [Methanoregulaceae archaeon]|nr:CBS domain-containing protein [Methanoregulaceae archaeon]HRY74769.1 CBS domain-containing protein [Methanoregulaceae archaeon]
MNRHERGVKQGDKLLKMQGKFDRGPIEFQSRIPPQEGEIMAFASRDVVSIPQTTTILKAVGTMTGCNFRRLPITDSGTKNLRGIITSGDIINFMGGGDKYRLVKVKHGGNLLSAVNESVREIMTRDLLSLPDSATIADAIALIIEKKTGGLPITGAGGILKGIVTERDVLRVLASEKSRLAVEDVMTTSLRVTNPERPIAEVTRDMTRYRFRRLPVVSDDVLFGIITATDIMRYLGGKEVFARISTGDISEVTGLPVRNLIAGDLFTTSPDRSIAMAAREMLDRNIGALPVIEDKGLIGLVTEFDLVRAFARG